MRIFEMEGNQEEIADALLKTIEKDSGKEVFTLRIIGEMETEEALETVIVFQDKSVLMGKISVQDYQGKLAFRVQGNWI